MIQIRNKHDYHGGGTYVGRPTPLGNPYEIGKDGNREQVIAKYREWLIAEMEKDGPPMRMFVSLFDEYRYSGRLILICWCYPQRCHAEVIKEMIMSAYREKK